MCRCNAFIGRAYAKVLQGFIRTLFAAYLSTYLSTYLPSVFRVDDVKYFLSFAGGDARGHVVGRRAMWRRTMVSLDRLGSHEKKRPPTLENTFAFGGGRGGAVSLSSVLENAANARLRRGLCAFAKTARVSLRLFFRGLSLSLSLSLSLELRLFPSRAAGDCVGPNAKMKLDPTQPLYIIELGADSRVARL